MSDLFDNLVDDVEPRRRGRPLLEELRRSFRVQMAVVGALVLRDMRTRFGRTHFGFLIAIAWPLSHLGFMMLGYLAVNRVAPLGNSPALFVATGALPYILYFYPARLMTFTLIINKPLLYFPVVKVIDVLVARIFLELVSAACILAALAGIMAMADVEVVPDHPEPVALGIALTIYLGIGFGALNAIIAVIFRPWNLVSLLVSIGLYASAGALFVPAVLSEGVRNILWYNPLYQCISLLRAGYYAGISDDVVSPFYIFMLGTVLLVAGVLGERLARGRILQI